MAFYLWEKSNLPFPKLIDRLVQIAKKRYAQEQKRVYSYPVNILRLQGKEMCIRDSIKRVYKDATNRIMIDGYELDEEQRKVFDHGKEIDLTTKEFDLLMMFIKNKGMAFNRDKILTSVWEENYFGSDRVVDDTLRRLRKKLPNLNIHTIYGYGYRLG